MASVGTVITDEKALMICRLSGIEQKRLENQIITLKDLRAGLETALLQLKSANGELEKYAKLEIGLRVVSVICDTIFSVASNLSPAKDLIKNSISYGKDYSTLLVNGFSGEVGGAAKESAKMIGSIKVDIAKEITKSDAFKKFAGPVKDVVYLADSIFENYLAIKATANQGGITGAEMLIGQIQSLTSKIKPLEDSLNLMVDSDCAKVMANSTKAS